MAAAAAAAGVEVAAEVELELAGVSSVSLNFKHYFKTCIFNVF
mgnify:CR=1 FL=1